MDRIPEQDDRAPLTGDEYAAVRAAVLAATGRRATDGGPTLNALFGQWHALVAEVEEGYGWSAVELSNDLWCRGALERAWPLLPPRVRAVRAPELDALDERFRAATLARPGEALAGGCWWERRVPRCLRAEPGEPLVRGWPAGWSTMPFPRPDEVVVDR